MRAFPLIRDLVTDVSWNYEVNKTIQPFTPPRRHPAGGLALAAGGHRAGPGIPQVHRVLPVPGRLPRAPQPRDREAVHGAALPRPDGGPRDASDRRGRPARVPQGQSAASATATSRSAAPRSAPSTSRSPTTRSSRSRSGSPTSTTTRSSGPGASSAAARGRQARTAGVELPRAARDRPRTGPRLPRLSDHALPASLERGEPDRRRAATPRPRRPVASSSAPTAPPAATPGPPRSAPRCSTWRAPTPATPRAAGRLDLGLPRRPDQQRRRVHRRRSRARAGHRARRTRGPSAPRLEADRRAAQRSLAGQGRQAHPAVVADALKQLGGFRIAGPRPTCRARRTPSPTRCATRRSTGSRQAGPGRSSGGRATDADATSVPVESRVSEAAGWLRVAAGQPERREESPSSPAQGSG